VAHLWRSRVSPRHKHKFHGGAIFKGRKHGIPLLSAATQRFLAANLNIPTPRVELYINKTKPEAFRRRRRISYPYPTPIVVCAGLLLCCRGNRRTNKRTDRQTNRWTSSLLKALLRRGLNEMMMMMMMMMMKRNVEVLCSSPGRLNVIEVSEESMEASK